MSLQQDIAREPGESLAFFSGSVLATLLRLGGLAILDAFALWLCYQLFADGNSLLAIVLIIVTVGLNVVFLFERFYPFRWLSPGLALMGIMVIYPTIITVYYAFTNYSTGNLLTQPVATERIQLKAEYRYLPEGEQYYDMTAYRNSAGEYILWLVGRDDGEQFIARPDEELTPVTDAETGLAGIEILDSETAPTIAIEGYEYVLAAAVPELVADQPVLSFSYPLETIEIVSLTGDEAFEEGYRFDPDQSLLIDFNGRSPTAYIVQVFQSDAGEIALWMVEQDGDETILARPDEPTVIEGVPQTIGEYRLLSNRERIEAGQILPTLSFGTNDNPIFVDAFSANRAGRFRQQFTYDVERDRMLDQVTGAEYTPIEGTFTLVEGTGDPEAGEILEELTPGYYVPIGFDNFVRLLTDERLRGPFVTIFLWTVFHAAATVFITFSMGLALALLFNDPQLPYRKLLRSVILIPYAIPAFISTVVWRGIFDPNLGVVNDFLTSVFGAAPNWYQDATAARFAILMVQMWLGFPYMMLIITGALQALPSDIYEAAEVDGANAWQRFRNITLPLLLVAVGPLLIASFAFNFNNFTVIELFNSGGPAIPNSSVPAGFTDILITYTYAQAFGTAGGTDYAFASAISLFIFFIVAAITIFNFRFTRAWEEVSENV